MKPNPNFRRLIRAMRYAQEHPCQCAVPLAPAKPPKATMRICLICRGEIKEQADSQ